MTNSRAVSAPYFSMRSCGSTPLFFDFDMVPMPSDSTGLPSERNTAPMRWPLVVVPDLDVGGVVVSDAAARFLAVEISFSTIPCVSRP